MRRIGWTLCLVGMSILGCSTSNPAPLVGCTKQASVTIDPVAIPVAGSTNVTVTGAVVNAPCGVQGVSVLDGISATATLPQYATWSATVPVSVLEAQQSCPWAPPGASADAATTESSSASEGVLVKAAALLTGDPGGAPLTKASKAICVSVLPSSVGSACAVTSPDPCVHAGPAGDWCALPVGPSEPVELVVYTTTDLLGHTVSWASGASLVTIEPALSIIQAVGTADGGPANCCIPGPNGCAGVTKVKVLAGTKQGIDLVSAVVDVETSPVGTWTLAVQGPAAVNASATSIQPGGFVDVQVANPLQLQQSCVFAMTSGIEVDETSSLAALGDAVISPDGGAPLDGGAPSTCPLSSCKQSSFTDISRTFRVSAPQTASTGDVVVTCSDDFEQTTETTIKVSLPKNTDGGGD
jgi:hypothetical protein